MSLADRWHRPRSLKRVLAGALVLATIASVLLVGALNWVAARRLLDDGTKEQLVSVGQSRARSLEGGVVRVLDQVSASAADLAVVDALDRLSEGFDELAAESLTSAQEAELDDWYEDNVIGPVNDAGLGPVTLDEVDPPPAARYLQYHYTIVDVDDRPEVTDPGDGSAYSGIHAEVQPFLRRLASALELDDLLLINDAGDIVYSDQKRIDLGTALDGPIHDGSQLAESVLGDLTTVRTGEAVLGDFEIYIPGGGRPVLFAVAAVRSGTEVIGSLAAQIPADRLSALTTGNGDFEAVGLGDGENYVVSASGTVLQSESRLWIEDPDSFLDETDDDTARLVEIFGSPVGIQVVDTEAVNEAIDATTFEGATENYLGQRTYTHATLVDVAGTSWISVTEVKRSDARAPLLSYGLRLGLVMLVTVPVAALIGIWLANRLTRPIPPVVAAAEAVAHGDRDPDLPDLGRDEFGDLARRLGAMAQELDERERELEAEFEHTRSLLLSVLPPRIVDPDGEVTADSEAVDVVTVVSVDVVLHGDAAEHIESLNRLREAAEDRAETRSMERVRAAADRLLFLAGVGADDDGADTAVGFAQELLADAQAIAERDGVDLAVKVGMSTGPVATGVLQRGSLTFAAWGEPVRRALAIGALSRRDEVLVDASTEALAESAELVPADEVVALDGHDMTLYTLAHDG